MNLSDAKICLDCEKIHQLRGCPKCGSRAVAPISRWLRPFLSQGSPMVAYYRGLPREKAVEPPQAPHFGYLQ